MDTKEYDKKYQIFISSTYEELKEQRKDLINCILRIGHIPSGMEMFSPGDKNEFEVIKKAIKQSDIYVVLVGSKYGSTKMIGKEIKSYTQLEYEYATQEAKKPHIVYVLEEGEFADSRAEITKNKDKDMAQELRIREFRETLMKNKIAGFFSLKDKSRSPHVTFSSDLQELIRDSKDRVSGYIKAEEFDKMCNRILQWVRMNSYEK